MSDCPVCVGIPGYKYHTCGEADLCEDESPSVKKYTEAELQEKLRQQREGFKHNLSVIENELKQIDEAECSLAVWDRVCIALEFAEK